MRRGANGSPSYCKSTNLLLARRAGLRTREIPDQWRNDPNTRVTGVGDSMRMFGELLGIRWSAMRGVYKGYPA